MSFQMTLKGVEEEFARLFQTQKTVTKENNRKQVSTMVSELKAKTPVDTGLAQSSWKTTENENGINVENTAEYIQYLNEGSSKQAPARFIESTALKYGVPVGAVVEVKGN